MNHYRPARCAGALHNKCTRRRTETNNRMTTYTDTYLFENGA